MDNFKVFIDTWSRERLQEIGITTFEELKKAPVEELRKLGFKRGHIESFKAAIIKNESRIEQQERKPEAQKKADRS
jgi:hypothetical protein